MKLRRVSSTSSRTAASATAGSATDLFIIGRSLLALRSPLVFVHAPQRVHVTELTSLSRDLWVHRGVAREECRSEVLEFLAPFGDLLSHVALTCAAGFCEQLAP